MNEKKEKKGKKILLSCIAVALVCAVSVGSTLALSKATAQPKDNTFTTPNIDVKLTEPAWDGSTSGEYVDTSEYTDTTLGVVQARKYYNGQTIPKDPKLTNTCDYGEYVAIKLQFKVNNKIVTQADFKANVADFTVKSGWVYDSTNDAYFYMGTSFTKLNAGATTANLFDNVTVRATENGSCGTTVSWTSLPQFDIIITGYAVQSDNLAADQVDTIKGQLTALM